MTLLSWLVEHNFSLQREMSVFRHLLYTPPLCRFFISSSSMYLHESCLCPGRKKNIYYKQNQLKKSEDISSRICFPITIFHSSVYL